MLRVCFFFPCFDVFAFMLLYKAPFSFCLLNFCCIFLVIESDAGSTVVPSKGAKPVTEVADVVPLKVVVSV
jgi:hypothetical protein